MTLRVKCCFTGKERMTYHVSTSGISGNRYVGQAAHKLACSRKKKEAENIFLLTVLYGENMYMKMRMRPTKTG